MSPCTMPGHISCKFGIFSCNDKAAAFLFERLSRSCIPPAFPSANQRSSAANAMYEEMRDAILRDK
jgi:hypothetical protein